MAKVYTLLTIMVGLMIFLPLVGFDSVSTKLLGDIIDMDGTEDSDGFTASKFTISIFFLAVVAVFALGTAGIFIGTLKSSPPESFLLSTFSLMLLWFVVDMVSIINQFDSYASWIRVIAYMLILPVCVGYVIAVVSWWRGAD